MYFLLGIKKKPVNAIMTEVLLTVSLSVYVGVHVCVPEV